MSWWLWFVVPAGLLLAAYCALVVGLVAAGRREMARGFAGFVPDCVVFARRLLGDPRVPRRRKVGVVLLAGYLASPLDLVPDFIPVLGQLDDVLIGSLALRVLVRAGGPELVREHWPGPETSLKLVLRLAAPPRRLMRTVADERARPQPPRQWARRPSARRLRRRRPRQAARRARAHPRLHGVRGLDRHPRPLARAALRCRHMLTDAGAIGL